jgi:lysophospholipase L1-like esterase
MTRIVLILSFISYWALDISQKKDIRIFLAGDSTMSIKEISAYPETGWGMPFEAFWDASVKVVNRAKNGRSTKTFISEGLWQSILDDMQAGDYVFIQFGHNDESIEKQERYTSPDSFALHLQRFVSEVRVKKGNPVLLTPVARRKFNQAGEVQQTHPTHSPVVKKIAVQEKVPFIDLDALSMNLYQDLGTEQSKMLFLQLAPGEHPNYPNGIADNTHFNEVGARLIAQIVLKELRGLLPELQDRIVKGRK